MPFLRRAEQEVHWHREAVIDLHLVADRQVELVEDHRLRDVRRQFGVPLHHRHRARTPTFIRRRKFLRTSQRKGRNDLD
jgi:hypothetical protein